MIPKNSKNRLTPPAESVASNQQSNPENLQKSDLNLEPKTGTESMPEQGRTEQSANTDTDTSELGSTTAPTSLQSIDMHMTLLL